MASKAKGNEPDYSRAAVRPLLERCIDDARLNYPRLSRDRIDMRNLLMYRGGSEGQWVVWDSSQNQYVPRPYDGDAGLPEWIPRATSNVFANKIDGITSILNQSQPALQATPSSDDDEDKAGCEVAEHALPVLHDEIGWPELKRKLNHTVALSDKAAVLYYYDTDERWGMDDIQLLNCPACRVQTSPMAVEDAGQACPECGQSEGMEDALDEFARPVTTQYPRGKMRATLLQSTDFSVPRSARTLKVDDLPWVLTHQRMTPEDIRREFGDAGARALEQTGSGNSPLMAVRFGDQAARLSGPAAAADLTRGTPVNTLHPVVWRLFHDPIVDKEFNYPEGLFAVMIGEEVIEQACGPLPVKDDDGSRIKPIVIRTFRDLPGIAYGKPPADDLVPLQQQRNLIETLILMILMHDAAPRTFLPTSVSLEDEITGQPGQTIRFRSMDGQRPTTDHGINPPEGLYKFLEMTDEKFEQLSNMNAVLQGQRPSGDPTLGEVQILQEQGHAAFSTPLAALVDFEIAQARMLIRIAKQSAWSPRFRKVLGENGQWEVEQFSALTLDGVVDWTCEPASAWPKSPLMQNLRLQKAIEWGIVQPAADPELAAKLLEQMDLSALKPSLDVQRRAIARELDRWKDASEPGQIAPPNKWVKPELQVLLKTNFLLTETAERLAEQNPPVHQAMTMHVEMLKQQQAMEQMQQAALAAGPQKPGPPDQRTAVEKGDHSSLEQAIGSGALKPATAPAQTALPEALASGALQPAGVAQAQFDQALSQLPSIDDMIAADALRPLPPVQANGRPPVGPTSGGPGA